MKIFSQNCKAIPGTRSRERLSIIIQKIQELQPDVVFLQEVILSRYISSLRISNYHVYYEPRSIMIHGGLVTMVKKSEHVSSVHFEAFDQQGKLFSKQLSDRMLGKGFLCVQTKDLLLINTHLVYSYKKPFTPDATQKQQLEHLMRFIHDKPVVVLGGDFNFPEDSLYYKIMVPLLKDLTRDLGETDLEDHAKYDFIFVKGLPVTQSSASCVEYPVPVSDHRGIVCEIK